MNEIFILNLNVKNWIFVWSFPFEFNGRIFMLLIILTLFVVTTVAFSMQKWSELSSVWSCFGWMRSKFSRFLSVVSGIIYSNAFIFDQKVTYKLLQCGKPLLWTTEYKMRACKKMLQSSGYQIECKIRRNGFNWQQQSYFDLWGKCIRSIAKSNQPRIWDVQCAVFNGIVNQCTFWNVFRFRFWHWYVLIWILTT